MQSLTHEYLMGDSTYRNSNVDEDGCANQAVAIVLASFVNWLINILYDATDQEWLSKIEAYQEQSGEQK